jgi:hypothetical protein
MKTLRMLVPALLVVAASVSCGRKSDILARVGEREITVEQYRQAFAALSPEEQVGVLEPTGRLALMDRLITKNLLELALEATPPDSGDNRWISLYEDARLSDDWRGQQYESFFAAGTDTASLLSLTRRFRLRIVLMPDSSSAAAIASAWGRGGNVQPDSTALAPWSAGGSSLRTLDGPLLALPSDITEIVGPRAGEGAFVFPVYGAWAAAEFDLTGQVSDTLPSGIGTISFLKWMESRTALEPVSSAIDSFAAGLAVVDGTYRPGVDVDGATVLVRYEGGAVTAGDIAWLLESMKPDSFFGMEVPEELQAFAPPRPGPAGAGVDIWFYATSIASTRWAASMARSAGLQEDPGSVGAMASVEALLRRSVLSRVPPPDSAVVLDFYQRNRGALLYPERRSVLLAYLPEELSDSLGPVSSFDAVETWSPLDEEGDPVPTPLQVPESFGPMGEAIFSSAEGSFGGPVETGTEGVVAYFQVVEVAPPDTAEASEIWGLLSEAARAEDVEARFAAFVSELRLQYGVEIDSAAVEAVDPWGSTY